MSTPDIVEFLFDGENEEKVAAHGLSIRQVAEVLDNEHRIVPNRKGWRGLYLVIGRDNSEQLFQFQWNRRTMCCYGGQ